MTYISQAIKTLIKLVLSITFAEKADLGWDTTMNADYEGNVRTYDIEICGKHYTECDSSEDEGPTKRAI